MQPLFLGTAYGGGSLHMHHHGRPWSSGEVQGHDKEDQEGPVAPVRQICQYQVQLVETERH